MRRMNEESEQGKTNRPQQQPQHPLVNITTLE